MRREDGKEVAFSLFIWGSGPKGARESADFADIVTAGSVLFLYRNFRPQEYQLETARLEHLTSGYC